MSSLMEMGARVKTMRSKRLLSRVCWKAAARVMKVLPVPALPAIVTRSIWSSISRLRAKFWRQSLAWTPQTLAPWR